MKSPPPKLLSIGLMSGTSMDGIDAALIETDGACYVCEIAHTSLPYDAETRVRLKAAEQNLNDLEAATQLSTRLHIQAVQQLLKETGYQPHQIDVVGYHGQTLLHQPAKGVSIIIGDGQALAQQVGITVVNDFRSNDLAAGGQGAPFAPIYHLALARRDGKIPAAVVNCGGIANVTLITSPDENDLIGFDTGPGNGLIDRLVRQRTNNQEFMDKDGRYGLQGKVHPDVMKALYERAVLQNGQNFFTILPPKALDSNDLHLVPELDTLSLPDACRTLEAFTADTIVSSIATPPPLWILVGGGWYNPVIRHELQQRLTAPIVMADEIGWQGQTLEAQLFAYLAVRSLQNKPLSFPGTTGVPRPMTGGRVFRH